MSSHQKDTKLSLAIGVLPYLRIPEFASIEDEQQHIETPVPFSEKFICLQNAFSFNFKLP